MTLMRGVHMDASGAGAWFAAQALGGPMERLGQVGDCVPGQIVLGSRRRCLVGAVELRR